MPDFRKRFYSAYLLVLALGAILAGFAYSFSDDVLKKSQVLVADDIPNLHAVTGLKANIVRQEVIFYEYYADQDAGKFQENYRWSHELCLTGLEAVEKGFGERAEVAAILVQYEDMAALAGELQQTLGGSPVDWDQSRLLLSRISAIARQINSELDALVLLIESRVGVSSRLTEDAVLRLRYWVLLLGAAILILSLFVIRHVNAYVTDQTERRRLAMFPERNPNPILRLGLDGQVQYANPGARQLAARVDCAGTGYLCLLPDDIQERLAELSRSESCSRRWEYTLHERDFECTVHYFPDLECFHAYVFDVTQRKQAEQELIFCAYHDALTQLPNRLLFKERFEEILSAPGGGEMRSALFLMGLDRFKVVIGSLGHDIGDSLLKVVSERLESLIGRYRHECESVTLYRFEGDIFAILLHGIGSRSVPRRLATEIIESMHKPLYVNTRELYLTFSVGISIYPLDGRDNVTLLKNADSAMQQAKQQNGNQFKFYSLEMNAMAAEELSKENYLRHAISRNELCLYYQPQLDLRSGRICGLEALLRWQHPERGLMLPDEFVPVAEETGMIVPLSEWTLRTACRQNKSWQDQGVCSIPVAINISGRQFHQMQLTQLVALVLEETGLAPETLELEITESVALQELERTQETLRALKKLNLRLAIDDFGTGFSSLSYLKAFPVDKMKLDKAFVRNLTTDPHDSAISRAVITLASSLGLKVIAEGVDSEAQLEWLRKEGCDEIQGFLLSAPLPAEEIPGFLSERRV